MSNEQKWWMPIEVKVGTSIAGNPTISVGDRHLAMMLSVSEMSKNDDLLRLAHRFVEAINLCADHPDLSKAEVVSKEEIERLRKMDSGAIVRETDSFITMQTERDAAREKFAKLRASHAQLLEALKLMYDTSCTNYSSTPSKSSFMSAFNAIKNAEALK